MPAGDWPNAKVEKNNAQVKTYAVEVGNGLLRIGLPHDLLSKGRTKRYKPLSSCVIGLCEDEGGETSSQLVSFAINLTGHFDGEKEVIEPTARESMYERYCILDSIEMGVMLPP